jgi:hypothetical protein
MELIGWLVGAVILIYGVMVVRARIKRNRFVSLWRANQNSYRAADTWVQAEIRGLTSRGDEVSGTAYGPSLEKAAGEAAGFLNVMLQGRGRLVQVLSKSVITESKSHGSSNRNESTDDDQWPYISDEPSSDRFQQLFPRFREDSRIQSVLGLDVGDHDPPEAIEEVFQAEAASWAEGAPGGPGEAKLGQAFYTLMRQGWTLGHGLLEVRGESLLVLGEDISLDEWAADVEALRPAWFAQPDMGFLSDEAFYCLSNVQDFGGVAALVGVDSFKEGNKPANRALILKGNLAVMLGTLCVMCLSETEAF